MRVSGRRKRVKLSEVELEPAPPARVPRIASWLSVCVWAVTLAVATAIYFQWDPTVSVAPPRPDLVSSPALPQHSDPPVPTGLPPEDMVSPPVAPSAVAATSGTATRFKAQQNVAEDSRLISGSDRSDNQGWVGAW